MQLEKVHQDFSEKIHRAQAPQIYQENKENEIGSEIKQLRYCC